jgi:hypothetical protein
MSLQSKKWKYITYLSLCAYQIYLSVCCEPCVCTYLYTGMSGSPPSMVRNVRQHCCSFDLGSFQSWFMMKSCSRGKKHTWQNTWQYSSPCGVKSTKLQWSAGKKFTKPLASNLRVGGGGEHTASWYDEHPLFFYSFKKKESRLKTQDALQHIQALLQEVPMCSKNRC